MRTSSIYLTVIFLFAGLIGCGSSQTLSVTSIQLGRSLNADSTVAKFTTSFVPADTVYVSIVTAGVGSATLSVRWTFEGRVVDEPTKKVYYRDVAATEFHLQRAGALPPGAYVVEAFLDGKSVGTRPFQVAKPD